VRTVALASVVLGAVLLLCGMPFALLLRRARDGWVATAVDAAVLGLVALPLGVTLWTWWGAVGAVVAVAGWSAALVAVVVPALRHGTAGLPARPARPDGAAAVRGALWVAVLGGAGFLRLREVNFLPWVGDMGGYVNWANELARTGTLDATWPPLFSNYLVVGTVLFGPAHTTVGMAAVGLVLVLAIARLLHQLGVGPWVVLAAGAVVATQVHAVWFGTFPVSESLAAPFLVAWLLTVHRALQGPGRVRHVVAGGVVVLALCLLRANGPLLLVPVLLVLVAVVVVRAWRPFAATWAWVTAAFVAAAGVGYWYGISVISHYYVRTQLPMFLPDRVLVPLRRLGLFDATWQNAGVLLGLTVVGCALVVAAGVAVSRLDRRRAAPDRSLGETAVLVVAAAGLGALVVRFAAEDGDVWRIVERMGAWLLVGAVVGAVAGRWLPDPAARPVVLVLVATVVLYLVFQDSRLGPPREHAYYLYWDRYLFSEVFPAVVVLSAVGLHQLLRAADAGLVAAQVPDRPRAALAAPLALGAAVAVGAWSAPRVEHANAEVFLRGAYELTEDLADVALEEDAPVLWSTAGGGPIDNYFFPNTWMALAKPLVFTFGLDVLNLDRPDDFASDQMVSADQVRRAAACTDSDRVTVLEVMNGDLPLDVRLHGSDLPVTAVAVVGGSMQVLAQTDPPADWGAVHLEVTAWRVDVPVELRTANAVCDPERWRTGTGGLSQAVR
jgi:hypothetical protein